MKKDQKELVKLKKEAEKEAKKILREQKKLLKKEKKEKPKKSEAELIEQAAKIIIAKSKTRGFTETDNGKPSYLNWQDNQFFFSVVFQSSEQKADFLDFLVEKFNIEVDYTQIQGLQVVNGVKLASHMGCQLKKELAENFPLGNIELRELILDE